MSLWLCIRFPQLALECRGPIDIPAQTNAADLAVIVIEGQRVIAINEAAASYGIQVGCHAPTAQALLPDNGAILHKDKALEEHALEQLQLLAYSITPTLVRWQDNCLQLEIGCCLRLYGSLDVIMATLHNRLQQRGFSAEFGVAHSRNGAWLMTFLEDSDQALNPEIPVIERAAELPLKILKYDKQGAHSKTVERLQKAGIADFGSLQKQSPTAVGKRCGQDFLDWLQTLTRPTDDLEGNFSPPAYFYDALWFGFEIRQAGELAPAIQQLLNNLCQFLDNTQRSTEIIQWRLLQLKGTYQSLEVRASSAGNNRTRWAELSLLHLENYRIPKDIEGLGLHVTTFVEREQPIFDLFANDLTQEPKQALLDRLKSRMGLKAVQYLTIRDAHLPEENQYWSDQPEPLKPTRHLPNQRPFWLLREPQPLSQQDSQLFWNGPLTLLYGPERIEDNWWQRPVSRDYYIAQQGNGQPIWLFQDRHSGRWYVHGVMA